VIPRAPKGTDDILPPESEKWSRLLRTFDALAERYGYGLVMTPAFEATELFARGVGEATEIVEKQMFTFADKGGRSMTLRPEATASVVRAYLQAGRQGVFKAAYSGPMFRYEEPQAGRRRQFHQVGVEYLGEGSPFADVEVIEFGYRLLEALGFGDVVVLLNSIGDAADRIAYREMLVEYLRDHEIDLSADARARIETNPLRVLDSKADADVVAGAPAPVDHLGSETAAHFAAVGDGLERRGLPVEAAPRMVRGLDYYNRTVFEYESRGYAAAQAALGGGGRYDPLAEFLGGPAVPAVGLAMGVDRMILAMPEGDGGPVLDVFVAVTGPERRAQGLDLLAGLRDAGLRADTDLADRSLKAQFRAAGKRRAAFVAIVGDEWDEGQVTVRDMAAAADHRISIEEVAPWVSAR
jgi:histidyl-tRNA synthetase